MSNLDGVYVNPNNQKAIVTFNNIEPVKLVDNKEFNVKNIQTVEVDIPLGLFRFIDIELSEKL